MQYSSFPQANVVLDLLIDGVSEILREEFIGIYLYGSLVTGDFDLAISDLDLVVIMTQPLDDERFHLLNQLHQNVVNTFPEWEDRLELAYVSRHTLKSFRKQTSRIGIISPGEPFHQIDAGADWLISWYALRKNGIALRGPKIKTLVDPISLSEYLLAVRQHIEAYQKSINAGESKPYLSYVVLTTARGLYTLQMGFPTSKIKAAAWAAATYPKWAELIMNALLWRSNPAADELKASEIRPQVEAAVRYLLAQIPDKYM